MKVLFSLLSILYVLDCSSQNLDSLTQAWDSLYSNASEVVHYSGRKMNRHFFGTSYSNEKGNLTSVSYTIRHDSAHYLFKHQVKYYNQNSTLKLDSILNFSKRGKAKQIVKSYYPNGRISSKKVLKAHIDKHRRSIPLKTEVIWNGKLVRYSEKGKQLGKKVLSGIKS